MNVSVPDEIRGRMEKVRQAVNWSAVATEAFVKKLAEIASRKSEQELHDVIHRLRASRIDDVSEIERRGRKAGTQWAKRQASFRQLERLAVFRKETPDVRQLAWKAPDDGPALLATRILGLDAGHLAGAELRQRITDFWGDDWENAADDGWLDAFIDGAVGVWEMVSAKV